MTLTFRSVILSLILAITSPFVAASVAQDAPQQTSPGTSSQPQQPAPAQSPENQGMPSPEQMKKDAAKEGYSQQQLQQMGIDLSNPTQALERARALGVPESDIQNYLKRYQAEQGQTAPDQGAGVITEPQPEVTGETGVDVLKEETPEEETQPTAEEAQQETQPTENTLEATGRFAGLKYFGYDVLHAGRGNFQPIEVGPVDPGYVISAGDVLMLYLWGDVEFQYQLNVDPTGAVIIPRAGRVTVAGTRLDNLQAKLKNFLSKFYSGLASNPPTVFMDVTISQLHGNQIYLMGEARRPGSYNISSFGTAFNLMYTTGGPRVNGSLRDIRILRNGKINAHIDFYDYLLKGISTDDKRLQNNDIVFIPTRGTTVGIKGQVINPGIFEIKDNETLNDVIQMAGGTKPTAYSFRAQIDRIIPFSRRIKGEMDHEVIDVDLEKVLSGKEKIELQDGDLISVFTYTDLLLNYVDVMGSGISRPGRYELTKVKTVSDLILAADSLMGDAYPWKADLVRTREDMTQEFISIDLQKALKHDPENDLTLMPMDRLRIYARTEWEPIPTVSLRGFVKQSGTFNLPDNKTLFDLIFEHAGLQDSLRREQTFMDRGDIFRLMADGITRKDISFSLKDVWNQIPGSNLPLEAKDIVVLHGNRVKKIYSQTVTISGSVKNPDTYPLSENMTLADLVLLAGGFTENAWVMEAEVSRISLKGMPGDNLASIIRVPLVDWQNLTDNPEDAVPAIYQGKTQASKFVLHPYDQVRIRRNPDYEKPGNVTIDGEVVFPGSYTLKERNETLLDLLNRAGGLKPSASIVGGQLFRNDNRLLLDFEELIQKKNENEDVVLHPGDRIVIPKQPNMVTLSGEVANPGFYKYIPGKRVRDYLNEAGGKTENGGEAYVTLPSGRTYKLKWLHNPKVKDGSVIRVLAKPPEKESEPIDWSGVIKDTMAVIASSLTILVLATKLK